LSAVEEPIVFDSEATSVPTHETRAPGVSHRVVCESVVEPANALKTVLTGLDYRIVSNDEPITPLFSII
jgi:hypothetical protein